MGKTYNSVSRLSGSTYYITNMQESIDHKDVLISIPFIENLSHVVLGGFLNDLEANVTANK